ncbi:MAG TPA: L-threonylcarbamoyladenylate synthase [Candidatus Saccharimonadales bacterium]|nr:L-threonylcarbamoyladenylate synthase [Candidatus Saccharimonadales bacterium]
MKIFYTFDNPELVQLLRTGAIGVMPTDTVYGLVALASNRHAVERMYALKRREKKPGPTIAASVEQLRDLGVDDELLSYVESYWPAPLSVILPSGERLNYLTQGVGESPFRVVADVPLRHFLRETGPLITSSANQPGEPVATTIEEAKMYFGNQVDFYVDGGPLVDREPSTIVRIRGEELEVLRPGAFRFDSKKGEQQ